MAQSISSETGHGGPGSSVVSGLIEMADYCLSQNPQQVKLCIIYNCDKLLCSTCSF